MENIVYKLPKHYTKAIKSSHEYVKKLIDSLAFKDAMSLTIDWIIVKNKPKTIASYTPAYKLIKFKLNEKGFLYASASWEQSSENWHATKKWWGTLTHEVGHAISHQYSKHKGISEETWIKGVLNNYLNNFTELKTDITKEKWKANPSYLVTKHISKYGAKSYKEAFAELLCIARDWDHPNKKLAFKAIKEIFK